MPYDLTFDFKNIYDFTDILDSKSLPSAHVLNQEWRYYYARFCVTDESDENLLALMVIGQYRKSPNEERARAIYQVFFGDKAPWECNVQGATSVVVRDALASPTRPLKKDLFDLLIKPIQGNMTDCWGRYTTNYLAAQPSPGFRFPIPSIKNGKVTITRTVAHLGPNKKKVLGLKKRKLTPEARAGLKVLSDAKFGMVSLFLSELYE